MKTSGDIRCVNCYEYICNTDGKRKGYDAILRAYGPSDGTIGPDYDEQ